MNWKSVYIKRKWKLKSQNSLFFDVLSRDRAFADLVIIKKIAHLCQQTNVNELKVF